MGEVRLARSRGARVEAGGRAGRRRREFAGRAGEGRKGGRGRGARSGARACRAGGRLARRAEPVLGEEEPAGRRDETSRFADERLAPSPPSYTAPAAQHGHQEPVRTSTRIASNPSEPRSLTSSPCPPPPSPPPPHLAQPTAQDSYLRARRPASATSSNNASAESGAPFAAAGAPLGRRGSGTTNGSAGAPPAVAPVPIPGDDDYDDDLDDTFKGGMPIGLLAALGASPPFLVLLARAL